MTVSGNADATGTAHTIYGRVLAQLDAIRGFYLDTLPVTISF